MRKLIFYCAGMLFSSGVFSQNIIKGKVTDDNTGKGIPNATVVYTGNKKGVTSDAEGNFSIDIKDKQNATLTVSSVGYAAATVKAKLGSPADVALRQDIKDGDEVVIIGYQTVRKKDALASVSSIGAKDLRDMPINSAAEALNGRLAGVTATTAEGSPDAEVRVRVRGGGSITQDNSPLYIVDGVQVENGLANVVIQDIQNIDVLKDAAATAIYGARGANGVIIITTKSGKPGKLRVSYNGFIGIKTLPKTLGVMSPYDFVLYEYERSRGSSQDSTDFAKYYGTTWDTLKNYQTIEPYNWQKKIMDNKGLTQTHNINMSGGSKWTTYNFSYTHNNEKAIVINSKYVRHQFNLRLEQKVTDKIKLQVGGRYTNQNVYGAGVSDTKGSTYNRLRNAVKYKPYLKPGEDFDDIDPAADPNVGNGLNLVNPVVLAESEYRRKTTDAYNLNANLTFNITKNLTFKSTIGYDYNNLVDRQFSDSLTPYSVIQGAKKPIVGLDTTIRKTLTNSNVLTYSIKNFKRIHDFDFLLGQETYQVETDQRQSLFRDFPQLTSYKTAFSNTALGVPFAGYPKKYQSKFTSLSFFSRINYAIAKKYLFTFNFRVDGSSKFAKNERWGYFPSGTFAWRISNEKFMQKQKLISDLKLRVSYGQVGNNRIDDYLYLTTFRNDVLYYGINNQLVPAYTSTSLVNEKLKWETTTSRNIGLDVAFKNGRYTFSIDMYNNSTKDLLLNVPVASTYGYSTQLQNIGKTTNKGLELQLGATLIRKKDFTWNINYNMSFNNTQIDALGVNQNFFYPAASWGVSGQPVDYIAQIGKPVGSFWGWVTDGMYGISDFDYDATTTRYTLKTGVADNYKITGGAQPGMIKFKDLNNDGIVDDLDKTIIGNPTPKFTGGLNQQFTYKNWDMSVFVNFSYGNDIYNANKIELTNGYTRRSNLLEIMADRWRTIDANGNVLQTVQNVTVGGITKAYAFGAAPSVLQALNANAKIWAPIETGGAFYPHSWAVEDGSFLRINNVTLGYSLPVKSLTKLGISKLRVYATINNLAVLTGYSGYDPEVSVRSNPLTPGLDYSAFPKSRSFIFGVNANF
jgi:TonB-dependent starch-binding outer membrane protein SusC